MKILITSGGTAEKIDNVRSITNTSTGRLGCAIADAFAMAAQDAQIFYVCGQNAAQPKTGVDVVKIDDVESAKNAISQILCSHDIGIIIHAMAVSDYRVKDISAPDGILEIMGGKIISHHSEITVHLERAPKIIDSIRALSPKSTFVGFKLLSDVPRGTLIDVAYAMLRRSDCDFVLANDTAEIAGDMHKGYLIDKYRQYSEHSTKTEIAQAIVETTLKHRRSVK